MLHFINLMKIIKPPEAQLCKKFYTLYYVHSRNFFILSFIISITTQFMGDAVIHCNIAGEKSITESMAYSFCYLNGTYTIVNNEIFYHHYYKWISMVLLIESFTFYLPYFVWCTHCKKYIHDLIYDRKDTVLEINATKCKLLLKEIQYSNFYMYKKHLFLEIAFFTNVILQFVLLHVLLNFRFFMFDFNILFPYIAQCKLNINGYGGGITQLNPTCNLPLNILYKKIFLITHVWFCFLILGNVVFFFYDLYTMLKHEKDLTLDQLMLYKIILYNMTGENKRVIQNGIPNRRKDQESHV